MPAVGTYNPNAVAASYGQIDVTDGVAQGTFITVARDNDSFAYEPGGDGGGTQIANPDHSGTIQVTLRYDSATNAALAAKLRAAERPDSPDVNGEPFSLIDFAGDTKYSCDNAFLQAFPSDDFGHNAVGTRVWTIRCPKLVMEPAGSNTL